MTENFISEYVRRDYNQQQNVTTELEFVECPQVIDGTADNHPVNLAQVKTKVESLADSILVPKTDEKITSAIINYYQGWGANNTWAGTTTYYGVGQFMLLTKNKECLYPVAFTLANNLYNWTPKMTSAQYDLSGGWQGTHYYIWLAKEEDLTDEVIALYNQNQGASLVRKISDPHNLTQEDEDYFAQFNQVLRIKAENHTFAPSNSNNWAHPLKMFNVSLDNDSIFSTSAQSNLGILSRNGVLNPLCLTLTFEDLNEDSIFWDIVGIQFLPFGCSGSYANSTIYGGAGGTNGETRIELIYNDRYIQHEWIFRNMLNTRLRANHVFCGINLTKDETYNNWRWLANGRLTRPLFKDPKFDFCAFWVWDDTNKEYVYLNDQTTTQTSDIMYENWSQER